MAGTMQHTGDTHPEIPMIMAGTDVPLLTMHQLLPSALSKASSKRSCRRIGTPCSLRSFTARFDDIAAVTQLAHMYSAYRAQ